MKFKHSVLTIYAIIFLLGCIGFTIYNYEQLSEGEGWGVVGMVGLFGFGVFLLVTAIALNNIVRSGISANLIGIAISIIATLLLIYGGFFS